MKTLIIGCQTMENELKAAIDRTHTTDDVTWIEARLHNVKFKLNAALQEILDQAADYERILFATGFCGNSISGLTSRDAPLIIPRVDDCTSLLCGSCEKKLSLLDSYFLTEGWLTGDQNIWNEYTYAVHKYGEKRAGRIFQALFAHYRRIALLDTGCYDMEPSLKKARRIADAFSLSCEIVPATTKYLELLLTGPWDSDHFLTVPPHTTITSGDLAKTY